MVAVFTLVIYGVVKSVANILTGVEEQFSMDHNYNESDFEDVLVEEENDAAALAVSTWVAGGFACTSSLLIVFHEVNLVRAYVLIGCTCAMIPVGVLVFVEIGGGSISSLVHRAVKHSSGFSDRNRPLDLLGRRVLHPHCNEGGGGGEGFPLTSVLTLQTPAVLDDGHLLLAEFDEGRPACERVFYKCGQKSISFYKCGTCGPSYFYICGTLTLMPQLGS